jgi:hypothetical protein
MTLILCDGCGQSASSEHTARRLQRLEWATRYRPIHLHTLLLGAVSPQDTSEFLYSPGELHGGEAARIFSAAGLETACKTADTLHAEFHRRGLFLTHVLECPFDAWRMGSPANIDGKSQVSGLLTSRLSTLFTRIRRSLKPKRIALISESLDPLLRNFLDAQLGCELLLDDDHPFALDSSDPARAQRSLNALQQVLAVPAAR